MSDILLPLGMLLLIVFFVYLIISTTRKQRDAKTAVFSDFADQKGFSYMEKDDGTVQAFAGDFDGIGRFESPSLGKVIPKDVVSGTENSLSCLLFRHSIRYGEGWAREWFVTGLTVHESIASRCAVQFCTGSSQKQTMHLGDSIIKEHTVGRYTVVVRAPSTADAGPLIEEPVLKKLAGWAESLPLRPEIQTRGKRMITYPAGRNATVDNTKSMKAFFEFTIQVAGFFS